MVALVGFSSCFWYFFHGMTIGLAIALPVGPIGLLCIQYALHRGPFLGLFAGLGAAIADTCFGLVAGLGLTAITDWILLHTCQLQSMGGLLLCFLGAKILVTPPHAAPSIDEEATPLSAFISTFLLTLANPLTIFAFMALFNYFQLANLLEEEWHAMAAIVGLFLGSFLWWSTLILLASNYRGRFSLETLMSFRRISGAFLILFGLLALLKCV